LDLSVRSREQVVTAAFSVLLHQQTETTTPRLSGASESFVGQESFGLGYLASSASRSSSSLRSLKDVAASPVADGPLHEGRNRAAGKTMESKMVVYTIVELMRLTRIELCDLAARITNQLPDYPETSLAYANRRETLRNIRRILARRDLDTG
jgi:hypothetical protein